MEKFTVSNSYYETLVAYDSNTQELYIKIGANNKVYIYPDVSQVMYKNVCRFNKEGKAIGSTIIYLNEKGSFGQEVEDKGIDWA